MKYFYYISEAKVEMLRSQTRRTRWKLFRFSPEFKLGPLSLKLEREQSEKDLVERLIELLQSLEDEERVSSSNELPQPRKSDFYLDVGEWRQGLYGFDVMKEYQFVTYVLWRIVDNSLVLLIGSPNNIIGEKSLADGCHLMGSGPSYDAILHFVDRYLKTDEPAAVGLQPPTHWVKRDSLPFPGVSNGPIELGEFPGSAVRRMIERSARWSEGGMFELPPFDNKAMALGWFCERNLANLPLRPIETVFRVFSEHRVPKSQRLASLAKEWDIKIDSPEVKRLFCYDRVYVGSPVYTALE